MKKCEHNLIVAGKCPICKKFIKWGKVVEKNPIQDLNKIVKKAEGSHE